MLSNESILISAHRDLAVKPRNLLIAHKKKIRELLSADHTQDLIFVII